jgi:glycosyltransferase involved in cell wall biosynthesis
MALQPAISVIIATYNRAHFLGQTIESVIQQQFKDFEMIVVDDGSTDDTREIVESFGSRVRYHYQSNQGAAAARNFGVQLSSAPWIAFQDSDDLCAPNHLSALYGYVRDHPECVLAFANGAYLAGPEHQRSTIIPTKKSQRLESRGVSLADLMAKSIGRLQAAIISKPAYLAVGGMDESLRICHDLDLFFRLFARFPVKYIDQVVFFYRRHQGNMTHDEELRLTENIKVIEKLVREFPQVMEIVGSRKIARRIAYRYYRLAKGRWKRHDVEAARQAIHAAVAHSPYSLKYRIYQQLWSSSNRYTRRSIS